MGNCQASEAAGVVIHHPGNKVETLFQSVKAIEVMNLNDGHYVALVVTSPVGKSENGTPSRQLKLLRPDDMLLVGKVYRLVSFEDVLKEFASKKTISLGKLTKEKEDVTVETKKQVSTAGNSKSEEKDEDGEDDGCISSRRSIYKGGQWKPSLQSIAEARV